MIGKGATPCDPDNPCACAHPHARPRDKEIVMSTRPDRPADKSGWWALGEQHNRLRTALRRLHHARHRKDQAGAPAADALAAEAAEALARIAERAEAAHPDSLANVQARSAVVVANAERTIEARRARRAGGTS